MDEYTRKADAVKRMKNYGSVWMEYTESMSKHEVAEQALKASKQAVIDVLENLPPADVAPVVHGRWIDDGTEFGCQCSECGKSLDDYVAPTEYASLNEIPNFCPNCGAKMDGEE